jgi:hypothetical protein
VGRLIGDPYPGLSLRGASFLYQCWGCCIRGALVLIVDF